MTGFRKLLFNIHLWIGLSACLLLFLLGITGALLTFEYKFDHLLNSSLAYVTPQAQRLPLSQLADAVKKQYPQGKIMSLELSASSPSPDLAYNFGVVQGKERLQVFVDQYTGQILGERRAGNGIMVAVHQLHTNLLGGPNLKLATTWGSVLLCLLALSGIYLWWPRKIFGASFSGNFRRINFDLHNSVGFYASVFVFIFAFTAVVMHWEPQFFPIANAITGSPSAEADPKLSSAPAAPGARQVNLDQIEAAAKQVFPGARLTQVTIPASPKDIVRVWFKYPEDGTPAGRTWVYLDQFTGNVLWSRSARTAPAGTRYMKEWNREIHTGDIFGWKSKIFAFLASLSVAFLSISGPLIWWLKRTPKKAAMVRVEEEELEEALA